MKPEYPERIRVWQNEPNKEFVASFPGDLCVEENSEYIRIDLHEATLLEAHQIGRREGLEEAAEIAAGHSVVSFINTEGRQDWRPADRFDISDAIRAKAGEVKA